jgi:hypothetical protein
MPPNTAPVIPAKAGTQYSAASVFGTMDPRLRGDDSGVCGTAACAAQS